VRRAKSRNQSRLVGVLLFALALMAGAGKAVAQCLQVQLDCIDCDGGNVYTYDCCPPSGCQFSEIENGDCNGPALCSYTCDGVLNYNYYYCGD
jgi:hypothetical protein